MDKRLRFTLLGIIFCTLISAVQPAYAWGFAWPGFSSIGQIASKTGENISNATAAAYRFVKDHPVLSACGVLTAGGAIAGYVWFSKLQRAAAQRRLQEESQAEVVRQLAEEQQRHQQAARQQVELQHQGKQEEVIQRRQQEDAKLQQHQQPKQEERHQQVDVESERLLQARALAPEIELRSFYEGFERQYAALKNKALQQAIQDRNKAEEYVQKALLDLDTRIQNATSLGAQVSSYVADNPMMAFLRSWLPSAPNMEIPDWIMSRIPSFNAIGFSDLLGCVGIDASVWHGQLQQVLTEYAKEIFLKPEQVNCMLPDLQDNDAIKATITRGKVCFDAIQHNDQSIVRVPNDERKERIKDLIWFLTAVAIKNGQGFVEGAFMIEDPHGLLYQLLNPNPANNTRWGNGQVEGDVYLRLASHLPKLTEKQVGSPWPIDPSNNKSRGYVLDTQTPREAVESIKSIETNLAGRAVADGVSRMWKTIAGRYFRGIDFHEGLPLGKKTLLFARAQLYGKQFVFIKPENHGFVRQEDAASHSTEFIWSFIRKQLDPEANDNPVFRKEHMPQQHKGLLVKGSEGYGFSASRREGRIDQSLQEQLYGQGLDNLEYRIGREVIIMKDDAKLQGLSHLPVV